MGILEFVIAFLAGFLAFVVEVISSIVIVSLTLYFLWFIISMLWDLIHEPSFKWFVRKVKSLSVKISRKLRGKK